jgi:NDP-sugar pyrophosphorylase family protein
MPFSKSPRPETAIILAGGRGTRLGALTEQTPKPLLMVRGRPFLFHVLDYLLGQGIRRVVLATGYLAGEFEKVLGPQYRGLQLTYSRETEPLGTGGAIVAALGPLPDRTILVLNGDTFFPAPVDLLVPVIQPPHRAVAMVLRQVPDVARYGSVTLAGDTVSAMHEKGSAGPGLINGGTYLIDRPALLAAAPARPFSLERDLLPGLIAEGKVGGCIADAYFVDIGIPADLEKAQSGLPSG